MTVLGHRELLRVRNLVYERGGRRILDGVDISLTAGEIVTVIGPNGAGKSTLARLILGLDKPVSGTIERAPDIPVGYVPQGLSLSPLMPMTVSRFLKLRPGGTQGAVEEVLALVGLTPDHGGRPVAGLSGGEFRRVLLARALMNKPLLLVLDEPTAGVDLMGQAAMYRLIDGVRRRFHCAVLLISHDLHLVMSATDRVVCLNQHVCCSGAPEQVRRDPAFRALFGAEADTVALYAHDHAHPHDHDHLQEGHTHA
jgi:zinc transport system ATP-binding protein